MSETETEEKEVIEEGEGEEEEKEEEKDDIKEEWEKEEQELDEMIEGPKEPQFEKGTEFELKLENSKILKTIVETLGSIIDETEIKITPEQFIITAMDPSRICLLKLTIDKEDFDEYEADGEFSLGINLSDLEKIMKRASSDDSLKLKHTTTDNKIKIIMQREGSARARTFTLALLDLDIEEIAMNNLLAIEYPISWVIDPDFLIEAIKDAEIYSEILNIQAQENIGLTFQSSGQIGEMVYELGLDEFIETDIESTEKGAYSLNFLRAIMKITSITEKLKVSLKTDHPIKMFFNLLEGGELNYFLAPRVQEAEFDEEEDMEEF